MVGVYPSGMRRGHLYLIIGFGLSIAAGALAWRNVVTSVTGHF